MGWTGMYDWSSSEKNKDILNREFFGGAERKYEALKWSGNGGHTWCLYRNKETNKVYAMLVLCSRDSKRHEFCYKEIELSMGPYEYDMPASWIPLIKETYKDEQYAQDWFKRREEYLAEKRSDKYTIGNILKCHNGRGVIEWGNGFKIAENTDFYVSVEARHTRCKTTKIFLIAEPNSYGDFYSRPYRLMLDTLKNLDSVEVVRSAK